MRLKFENNFYTKAYSEGKPINHKVFKENPQFKYKEPKFSEYSKLYNDYGWFERKIIAIPAAAWSAITEVIYHLVEAIFCGLPRIASDGGLYFKAQVFSIVRDLQESFGKILSIFHDRAGLFHIQQAQFYKSCYACFYEGGNENNNVPIPPSTKEDDDHPPQNSNNQPTGKRSDDDMGIPITTSDGAYEFVSKFTEKLHEELRELKEKHQQECLDLKNSIQSGDDIEIPITTRKEAHERVRKFNEGLQENLRKAKEKTEQYKQKCLGDLKNLAQNVVSKFNESKQKNPEDWQKDSFYSLSLQRIKNRVDSDVTSGAISKQEVYSILKPYFDEYPELKPIAEG